MIEGEKPSSKDSAKVSEQSETDDDEVQVEDTTKLLFNKYGGKSFLSLVLTVREDVF